MDLTRTLKGTKLPLTKKKGTKLPCHPFDNDFSRSYDFWVCIYLCLACTIYNIFKNPRGTLYLNIWCLLLKQWNPVKKLIIIISLNHPLILVIWNKPALHINKNKAKTSTEKYLLCHRILDFPYLSGSSECSLVYWLKSSRCSSLQEKMFGSFDKDNKFSKFSIAD